MFFFNPRKLRGKKTESFKLLNFLKLKKKTNEHKSKELNRTHPSKIRRCIFKEGGTDPRVLKFKMNMQCIQSLTNLKFASRYFVTKRALKNQLFF